MKRLETVAKHAFAWLMALLWWRPFRRQRAAQLLGTTRHVYLLRIDNRVGEALLTTPLFEALRGRYEVHVLAHPKCVRVLEHHPGVSEVIALERSALWWGLLSRQVRQLRAQTKGAVVINCASWADFSGVPGMLTRLIAPHAAVIAPAVGANRLLADIVVEPMPGTDSETKQRLHLLSPLKVGAKSVLPSFRAPRGSPAMPQLAGRRYAVLNPGGRLDWRRVPTPVFVALAKRLKARGVEPIVTWGPGEQSLAEEVAQGAQAAIAPPTDLDALAGLMAGAALTVCNNSGPMHLSVAVGVPTVGLFYKMPMSRWGHFAAPHRMVDLTGREAEFGEPAALERLVEEVLTA